MPPSSCAGNAAGRWTIATTSMRRYVVMVFCLPLIAVAGEVTIVDVSVECPGQCTFSVTLEHADEGWDHYADRWDVVTLEGQLLGSRVLYHPHENEQPFTRSLAGVAVPEGMQQVKIRAHDSRHGYSGQEYVVDLPGR